MTAVVGRRRPGILMKAMTLDWDSKALRIVELVALIAASLWLLGSLDDLWKALAVIPLIPLVFMMGHERGLSGTATYPGFPELGQDPPSPQSIAGRRPQRCPSCSCGDSGAQ